MKNFYVISCGLLLTLLGCGSKSGPGRRGEHVDSVAGHWAQDAGNGAKGMTLELDAASDNLMVHTAPEADGSHDHLHGTYAFDHASQTVTVKCELLGKGKGLEWRGMVDSERLVLTSGGTSLTFSKGADPHGGK